MAQRQAVVASRVGLHARPAATFVKAVTGSGVPVTVATGDSEPVDAGSILAVMTLGVRQGDEVTLEAEGDDAERVLDDLVRLLETEQA
ncbi:HPr family phosphocarrier protein [Georgenia sp. 10Sc9-8]|uniref:Phosphocarrier protein HPr n=1 Tax=Georgenia halotolerans TaxID=3028317 RepID=A0ABT5TT09_9MICO|nr:HPr family phosphocarrier protein [Georgenia halotolerans]